MLGVRTAGRGLPSVRRMAWAKGGEVRIVPGLFQLARLRIHQYDPTPLERRVSPLTTRCAFPRRRGLRACPMLRIGPQPSFEMQCDPIRLVGHRHQQIAYK